MTLLSVVKDVCAAVGVTVPQSVFSNITGNRTMQEMLSLANEMAQRIAYDTRDWTLLIGEASYLGSQFVVYPPDPAGWVRLPDRFRRLTVDGNIWRQSTPQTPMRFIPSAEEWLQRRMGGAVDGRGEWRIGGSWLEVFPVPEPTDVIRFNYYSKNFVNIHGSEADGESDVFLNDNDKFYLDERLLKLAMIYQWKAQKGSSYAEDMSTYGDALAIAMGHDQPAPIMIDRKPISAYARTAIPTQTIYVPGPVP